MGAGRARGGGGIVVARCFREEEQKRYSGRISSTFLPGITLQFLDPDC